MNLRTLDLRGRRATVMGLGLQGGGVETVHYLASRGARLTVTDARPADRLGESLAAIAGIDATLVLGDHRAEDFTDADLVIANPAVAPSHPLLVAARAAGVLVTSEMELFLSECPAQLVLITGTQGKSSTANATAQLLEACGRRVHLGGNIGRALINRLDTLADDDVAVVEISSYQLEALSKDFGPLANIAAVCCVNVLADHLERHGSVEAYEAAKMRLLELSGPLATVVLPLDDPRVGRWRVERGRELRFSATGACSNGLHIANGEFRLGARALGRTGDLRLPGAFQRANVLAALGLAHALGAPPEQLADAVGGLRGLEHRLEDLGFRAGRRVWDNAVSTTPDSTIAALDSLARPVTLLCGGQAKNLTLDDLVRTAVRRATTVVTFGASGAELARAFREAGVASYETPNVEEAVRAAFDRTARGGEILFSPACASFDAYRNFRDRALAFRGALPPRDPDVGAPTQAELRS